jgi:hypothetical protein
MGWRDIGAERTGWSFANSCNIVDATSRAWWHFPLAIGYYIGYQMVRETDAVALGQVMLQGKLICQMDGREKSDSKIRVIISNRFFKMPLPHKIGVSLASGFSPEWVGWTDRSCFNPNPEVQFGSPSTGEFGLTRSQRGKEVAGCGWLVLWVRAWFERILGVARRKRKKPKEKQLSPSPSSRSTREIYHHQTLFFFTRQRASFCKCLIEHPEFYLFFTLFHF